MLISKESDGTLQRTITVTIRPTPTEIADAIHNLDSYEQIVLLGCLKKRFCNKELGLMQIASVANELDKVPIEEADEVRSFIRYLADYLI